MPMPLFPLLGLPSNPMLLDPMTVFTPLTCGVAVLLSLCGLGLGMLIARADTTRTAGSATPHVTPPAVPKAA